MIPCSFPHPLQKVKRWVGLLGVTEKESLLLVRSLENNSAISIQFILQNDAAIALLLFLCSEYQIIMHAVTVTNAPDQSPASDSFFFFLPKNVAYPACEGIDSMMGMSAK